MNTTHLATLACIALISAACSSTPQRSADSTANQSAAAAPAPVAAAGNVRAVKSVDGSFVGEIVGTPAASSKFAKLKIGMDMSEVQEILGRSPDRSHSYESGKRWIPFYFGNDARRLQALYRGEGCLIFTGGNVWGGAGGDLVQIAADPAGACYQP
ncbi:MAG: hypothetical protein H7Y61_11675 [Rhizobiales bacterium]|nr:hypothetical protein [Rhizobacter sp.]